jgi:hypothetical protein
MQIYDYNIGVSVRSSTELPVWKYIRSSVKEPARKPIWDLWDTGENTVWGSITFSIHDYCVDYFEEK